MKFLISGNVKNNKPLFMALWFYIFFIFLYWIGGFIYFQGKFSFSPEGIGRYFFGDPNFPEMISFAQLTEETHAYIFIISMLLLTLSALIFYTKYEVRFKIVLVALSFAAGFFEALSGYIVYMFGRNFAFIKLFSFFLFQAVLLIMLVVVTGYLMKKNNDGAGNSASNNSSFAMLILAFINLGFLLVNFLLFSLKLGKTPADIALYYLGDPSRFMRPKTFSGIFEISYIHFLAMSIYLIALVHFLLFTDFRWKTTLATLIFASAFADNISGLLIRFVYSGLSYVKFFSFLLLQISMLTASIVLVYLGIRGRLNKSVSVPNCDQKNGAGVKEESCLIG